MTPVVSVVIPTWNRCDLLADCLASLAAQTYRALEIVVVDDGSTDDTASYVARKYPLARLVRLDRNSGFCVAANAGIRASTGGLVFLLNNDMTLEVGCIARLAEAAEDRTAALFAPLVLFKDEPGAIYSAGDRQRASGRPESIGFRCARDTFAFPEGIFGVSGGAGLYRREVFDRVGLLDESFIAYFEDSDLNFRARLAGFEARFVPEAVAYHVGSASLAGKTWWRSRQCFRNHALLVLKDFPAALVARHAGEIIRERWRQAARLVSAARAEFGLLRALGKLAGAVWSAWMAVPHCVAARLAIQHGRRIDVNVLDSLLDRNGKP